jgi:hypothetical protein
MLAALELIGIETRMLRGTCETQPIGVLQSQCVQSMIGSVFAIVTLRRTLDFQTASMHATLTTSTLWSILKLKWGLLDEDPCKRVPLHSWSGSLCLGLTNGTRHATHGTPFASRKASRTPAVRAARQSYGTRAMPPSQFSLQNWFRLGHN